MAIAFDATSSAYVASSSTVTFNHTFSGSNRYVFIFTADHCNTVTVDGVSATNITSQLSETNGSGFTIPKVRVWGLANPTSGTKVISVTNSSASRQDYPLVVSYNGVDSVQPEASNTTYTPNTLQTSISPSITTVTANAWIVGFTAGTNNTGGKLNTSDLGAIRTPVAALSNECVDSGTIYGKFIADSNAAKAVNTYSYTNSWQSGSGTQSSITYSMKPYLQITLTGPSSGNVNAASTNFTVTPDIAINGSVTITPSGAGSAGLSPTVLNFSNSSTPQTFTITPLTSGSITLTMTNAVGLNNSAALTYTANAVAPSIPTVGIATPLNASATVAFTGNSDGGSAITQYRAISTPGSFTGTGLTSPLTVSGLTNGVAYTFTVRATNAIGNSAESSASNSVTPYVPASSFTFTGPTSGNVRSASTNFTVTPNSTYNGTITLTPSGPGSSGLSPVVLTFNLSSAAQTFTITPLTSGAITLTPTNSNGISNPANLSYTANAVVPLSPSIGLAAPSLSSAVVSFGAPTNDGGASVTLYTVTATPGGQTATSTSPGNVTVRGLTNGTSYTFSVTATNSVGTSASSSASNAVIPTESSTSFTNSGPKFNITKGVGNLIQF